VQIPARQIDTDTNTQTLVKTKLAAQNVAGAQVTRLVSCSRWAMSVSAV